MGMEHLQILMYITSPIDRSIPDSDVEKASNSYLMSLLAMFVGLPLPILNLLATLIFFFANRKASPFVRWHCTQALLTQLTLFACNTILFWWTIAILFKGTGLTNAYFPYLICVVFFNTAEIIQTIISTIKIRKRINVRWWVYSGITDQFVKIPQNEKYS